MLTVKNEISLITCPHCAKLGVVSNVSEANSVVTISIQYKVSVHIQTYPPIYIRIPVQAQWLDLNSGE